MILQCLGFVQAQAPLRNKAPRRSSHLLLLIGRLPLSVPLCFPITPGIVSVGGGLVVSKGARASPAPERTIKLSQSPLVEDPLHGPTTTSEFV